MTEASKILSEAARALREAREALLAMRTPEGVWFGELSSSALATATAVSALSMARFGPVADRGGGSYGGGAHRGGEEGDAGYGPPGRRAVLAGASYGTGSNEGSDPYGELIARGLQWLYDHRNPDGGYGDTPDSPSNLPTTMLVLAAFALARGGEGRGREARRYSEAVEAAEAYVSRAAGDTVEKRAKALSEMYAPDRTFAAPIICNLALAGLMRWEMVPDLPFELAALPSNLFRFLRLHVVSYAMPALIAIGRLVAVRKGNRGTFRSVAGDAAFAIAMRKLEAIQPESGGFLEAVPLTAFVTMSLIGLGLVSCPVARKGLDFLRKSARADGSWPVDSNLSVWVTTEAVEALSPAGAYDGPEGEKLMRWLLDRQAAGRHPYTGAMPGGWGWTHLPGGVPDADDTAGALLALAALFRSGGMGRTADTTGYADGVSHNRPAIAASLPEWVASELTPAASRKAAAYSIGSQATGSQMRTAPECAGHSYNMKIAAAARSGIKWLMNLRNSDGGWPTFCRGWGNLPFDRSAPDLTAHVLRALAAWKAIFEEAPELRSLSRSFSLEAAISPGCMYLRRTQRSDGSWHPLWFGNQHTPDMSNPVIGTARVLAAYVALGDTAEKRIGADAIKKGLEYLLSCRNPDGGWGGGLGAPSTMEETALAVGALAVCIGTMAGCIGAEPVLRECMAGARFLARGVREGTIFKPAPIGLYFARLWYSERAYPVIWTVGALGRFFRAAAGRLPPP